LKMAVEGTLFRDSGTLMPLLLMSFVLLKMIATSITVGSGGSGGIYGPSLVIGGIFGAAAGDFFESWFPQLITQPGAFALVGMGAFFAGAANAPIASVVMVCELTGSYSLLAPLMLSAAVHTYLARRWSIYDNQVPNRFVSDVHKNELNFDILKSMLVKEAVDYSRSYVKVSPHDKLNQLESKLAEFDDDVFVVVNEETQKTVGLLDIHSIRKVIFEDSASALVIVEDMMEQPAFLEEDMDLHEALESFLLHNLHQLPVLSDGEVAGMLSHQDIINCYDRLTRRAQQL
jgi:chloride channel protein, CIC family